MNRQRITAAIDIGSSKITTLVSSQDSEDKRAKVIGVSSVPSRGIKRGQIVDIEKTIESVTTSVEAAERMAGYSLSKAVVSIGGAHISSQNSKGVVAVAEPEGEIVADDIDRVVDAARAISLPSSREIIHVIPRFYTVDGQEGIKDPMGMSGVRLEVETHIVSASATAVRNITKCVNEVGIEPISLVSSGIASAESVLSETERELGVVLVDIGGGTTSIVVYIEGAPFYTSVLPIGANNVTNDLAVGLRLSYLDVAEKIKIALSRVEKKPVVPSEGLLHPISKKPQVKIKKPSSLENGDDELDLVKLGISDQPKSVSKKTLVEGIIRPRLDEIFTMVGMEVKKSGAVGLTPAGVVLCGGGGRTIGAVDSAKRVLSMPVRVGEPTNLYGLIDEVQSPEYATACGLLLWGSKTEEKQSASFSIGHISKRLPKIPVGGAFDKVWGLIKSLLP